MAKIIKKRLMPIIIILAIVLTVSIVTIGLANTTTPPSITQFVPADQAVITTPTQHISLTVYDSAGIANSNYFIKVDGVVVNSTFNWRQIWVNDSCTGGYYSTDTRYATIYADLTLTDGPHTIEAQAMDIANLTVSKTVNVTVKAPPAVSNQNPINGFTAKQVSAMSFDIKDNAVMNPAKVVLSIDGTQILYNAAAGPKFDFTPSADGTGGTITYTPVTPFIDAVHKVVVTATDVNGNQSTTNWSFTTWATPPQITWVGANTTIPVAAPSVSLNVTSGVNLNSNSTSLFLDGNPISSSFLLTGHWDTDYYGDSYYTVTNPKSGKITAMLPLLSDGPHKLTAVAKDYLGSERKVDFDFVIKSVPTFSAPNPANGGTTKDNTGFSVKITEDNDNIDTASIHVYLDGPEVPFNFDPTTGILSYHSDTGMANGTHKVVINVSDTSGNLAIYNWSFIVKNDGPDLTYADANKTLPIYNPNIAIDVKSIVKLAGTGYSMQIDGVTVPAKFSYDGRWETDYYGDTYFTVRSYLDGTISYYANLNDGPHTIIVSATDSLGNVSTQSFNVTIAQPPVISVFEPANNSNIANKTPTIKAVINDPNGPAIDQNSVKLLVDNNQVVPQYNLDQTTGAVTVTYPASLQDEVFHNISLTIADTKGNTGTANNKFYVNTKWQNKEMPATAQDCGTCHTINQYNKFEHYPGHTEKGCSYCHDGYDESFCGYCHNGYVETSTTDPYAGIPRDNSIGANKACTDCHSSFYYKSVIDSEPNSIPRPESIAHDLMSLHKESKGYCNDCHSTYLTREHNRLDKQGQQITCQTCHASADPNVQTAILTKSTNCETCHTVTDHEAVHISGLDSKCQTCHSQTLSVEHISNATTAGKGYTCDICHSNNSKQVKRTIAADNLNCSGCHQQAHGINLADNVPKDIPLYLPAQFQWTAPAEVSVYAGQRTTPSGYNDGQVVYTDRRNDVTVSDVWNFYNQQLTSNQWILQSTAPAIDATSFTVEFKKDQRCVTVKYYNTLNNDGTGDPVTAGYKLEIWYK